MFPQTPGKHYIVRLTKAYEDEMVFESGVRLFKPTHINPEWHTTVTGEIVAKPKNSPYELSDTLLFTYDVVDDKELRDNDTPIHKYQFRHEGKYYWKVEDMFVLGAIRDGEILPVDDYVFLKPVEQEQVKKIGLIWVPDTAGQKTKKNRGEGLTGDYKGKTVIYDERHGWKYEVKIKSEVAEQVIVVNKRYVAAIEH